MGSNEHWREERHGLLGSLGNSHGEIVWLQLSTPSAVLFLPLTPVP